MKVIGALLLAIALAAPLSAQTINIFNTNVVRAGIGTTDTNGNLVIAFSKAFSAPPSFVATPVGTTTYSCQPTAAATATGVTVNCATIVSAGLGGATTRTNASGVVVDWHAVGAN